MSDDAEGACVTPVISKNDENKILSKYWKILIDKHIFVMYDEYVARINEHKNIEYSHIPIK